MFKRLLLVAGLLFASLPASGQGTPNSLNVDNLTTLKTYSAALMSQYSQVKLQGVYSNNNEGAGTFDWYGPTTASATVTGSMVGGLLTVASVSSGTISLGAKVTGSGVPAGTYIFASITGVGGAGTYLVSTASTVTSTTLTVSLIPNGGTIIPPSGQVTCTLGCLVKEDWRHPWLEDFGVSQHNTAAANTTALNLAIASATVNTGSPGRFSCGAGNFQFNGPVTWPSGVYPTCQGVIATKFIIANCANGFVFQGGAPSVTNVVGSHPDGFQMAPTCSTTIGNGGIGVQAIDFNQNDMISNVLVQPYAGSQYGGIGFDCQGCSHSIVENVTAVGINGPGIIIENSGSDTPNGLTAINLNAFNNYGIGITLDANDASNVSISGSAEGNNPTGGTQMQILRGMNLTVDYHIEGCPLLTSGNYCVVLGTVANDPFAYSRFNFNVTNPDPVGAALVNCLSGAGLEVSIPSLNGTGQDSTGRMYNIGANCSGSTFFMPSAGLKYVSANNTSRLVYTSAYNTGVQAKGDGSAQSVSTATWTPITYATVSTDPLSEYGTVTTYCAIACFTPNSYGYYQITGTLQIGFTAEGTLASNAVTIDVCDSTISGGACSGATGEVAIIAAPKAVTSGTVIPFSYTTPLIGPLDHIQIRGYYTVGSGSPTVTFTGTGTTNAIQIVKIK